MFTEEELGMIAMSVGVQSDYWLNHSKDMTLTSKRRQDFYDLHLKLKNLRKKVLDSKP